MMVEILPVGTDSTEDPPQQMTGQVRHLDPGQNQIPAVVSDQVKVVLVGLLGSSDELIAQVELAGSRTPSRARNGAGCGHHQILQMLAHRTAVPQVVITAEQMGKEFFAFGPAYQADLQRPQRRQGSLNGRGVVKLDGRHAPVSDRVIDR
jgi:hypothetical protein